MPRIKTKPDPVDQEKPRPVTTPTKSVLSRLTGNVRTIRANSNEPYGIPWSNVSRYAAEFERNAAREGIDPLIMAGMAVIESDSMQFREDDSVVCAPLDGWGGGHACGIMQVKNDLHAWRDPSVDYRTVDGNMRLAALILADGVRTTGGIYKGIVSLYFTGEDPNGTTQGGYIQALRSLVAEMRNQTQPEPKPDPDHKPPPVLREPLEVIFGGRRVDVEYGFLADVGLNYYSYIVGHGGTRPTQHTGDDCLVPDETPLYAPADGIVRCVGWEGNVLWGQGCGYFQDTMGGGIGNISLKLDSDRGVVLGHSSRAVVSVGQRVKAGQHVGFSGGMNGPHTHLEVAVPKGPGGSYWLVDPQPELRRAMKGQDPLPPEKLYAERLDWVPMPSEFDVSATVYAVKGGVPVLQRAYADAEEVRAPLEEGEDFEAVYQVLGSDERIYWITTRGSRVPVIGTRSDDWPVEE